MGMPFPFGPSLVPKNSKLRGFAQEFNIANDELGEWLVHIFGLPLFNAIDVGDCFVDIFRT